MRPTARHILELALILMACRLGGVDLLSESGYRKGSVALWDAADTKPHT